MSIRKKHIVHHYTIVEVMVAMGIFLVMMTIMMQFFTSAQKVWNAASKRNMMYADARVAMNVMTREIQSMLYNNDEDDLPSSIYPFWLEWTDIDVNIDVGNGEVRPQRIRDYFINNNDLLKHSVAPNSNYPYLTALNFISTTDLKPVDQGSDVCEIRYRFIPVYFKDGDSISNVRGGKLQRSCVAEYYDNSGATLTSTGAAGDYNFVDWNYKGPLPASPDDERILKVWSNPAPAAGPFQTVIRGVYSLRFTCYFWNTTSGALAVLEPMDRTSTGQNPAGDAIGPPSTSPLTYNLAMGTPVPVAIRIDMKLMNPKDLKKLAVAINEDNNKQIKNLKQKMRTFSKVIYLGKRGN
jgi:type II secretory pathway pseudopilin PulG